MKVVKIPPKDGDLRVAKNGLDQYRVEIYSGSDGLFYGRGWKPYSTQKYDSLVAVEEALRYIAEEINYQRRADTWEPIDG